uniref:FBA_2 domain-containing protein n=1 Tax=Caenorhabditis tropicalis TaxID=1561998 RepID=A0A1I7UP50_9PELO
MVRIEFKEMEEYFHMEDVFSPGQLIRTLEFHQESPRSGLEIERILEKVHIENLVSYTPNFTREALLLVNSPRAILRTTRLKQEDFLDFIRNWLRGSEDRIKFLDFSYPCNFSEKWEEPDLSEFNLKEWDPERRPLVYTDMKLGDIEFKGRVDIERKSDGVLASIINIHGRALFRVWPSKFILI